MPSNRAAILTPSPIRSPSFSSTTSPRWTPTRNSMRRSGSSVALDHAGLHLDHAAHRIDHAAELDDGAVACALHDASAMRGDGGVDEIATEAAQARQGAFLVRPRESAAPDNVGDQDCSELPGLG